ncbi:MAG: hypothetical protein D4R97_01975, partial [Bacteroidetes bacterium]
ILFSVQLAHTYYTGACQDFEFLIPADSSRILRERRIITRTNKGVCYFLCEKNELGVPVVAVSGITVRIGLKLSNPYFSNITKLDFKEGTTPLYRNQTVPTALDLPLETLLTRAIFSYTLTKISRPVTVSVKDGQNNILQSETVAELSNTTPVSIDLTGFPPSLYSLNEKQGSSIKKSLCYVDPDLARQQTFGIVEINLSDAFFTPVPPQFTLNFTSRAETLKYYIIGKNYTSSELSQLSVSDAGYNEDVRPQVLFTKVGQGSFAATDISPSLLTSTGSAVILFKSQNPVTRLEKARRKIQLCKNTDVILKHLPLPGIERPNSDIIIQISKP